MTSINASQPAIHSAALGLEGVRSISGSARQAAQVLAREVEEGRLVSSRFRRYRRPLRRYRRPRADLQRANMPRQRCGHFNFDVGASAQSVLRDRPVTVPLENSFMLTLQPAEWSKPRGFSHGVAVDGPGRWIVLAGQVGVALRRIIKLLGEAGAGPEHIVRLTWYLTSRSEYEAAGAGIGAAWRETLGRNFPPSTLLYIEGLVDVRAKVEIEVTAFVPTT